MTTVAAILDFRNLMIFAISVSSYGQAGGPVKSAGEGALFPPSPSAYENVRGFGALQDICILFLCLCYLMCHIVINANVEPLCANSMHIEI